MHLETVPAFFEAAARDLYNVVHPRTWRIDTFLVSFQKCGRTWLELMLAHGFAYKYGLPPSAMSRELPKMRAAASAGPVIFSTHDWSETTGETRDAISPYLMTAWPFRMRYWGRRVMMLIRDPRDVMVSSFYQVTRRAYRPLPFTDIDAYVLDPLYGFPRLVRFYKVWNFNRHFTGHFKVFRYEDLSRQGVPTLRAIFDYVGLPGIPEGKAAEIYELCRFENVRAMEDTGFADLYKFEGEEARKARRGEIGSFADELRPATIARLNEWMRELAGPFAYTP